MKSSQVYKINHLYAAKDEEGRGSYAIIDNSASYSNWVSSAYRGVLITNDKQTVVLQDEIALSEVGNLSWVVNTYEEIILDDFDNNRTAYLVHKEEGGETKYLRATLISATESIQFSVLESTASIVPGMDEEDAPANLFKDTYYYDSTQRDITGSRRLVINADSALSLSLAVVFEEVESLTDLKEVGYSYTSFTNWEGYFDNASQESTTDRRGIAVRTDIIDKTLSAEAILDDGEAFTVYITRFYTDLATVQYSLYTYPPTSFSGEYNMTDAYKTFVKVSGEYEEFAEIMNRDINIVHSLVDAISGI